MFHYAENKRVMVLISQCTYQRRVALADKPPSYTICNYYFHQYNTVKNFSIKKLIFYISTFFGLPYLPVLSE